MHASSVLRAIAVATVVVVSLAGCASAPTQEMADARQALQAAVDAGADTHVPASFEGARHLLESAQRAIEGGDYAAARADALATKKAAVSARNMALAVGDAKEALDRAAKLGYEWRDSRKLLDRARDAAARGEESRAVVLAGAAREQGELAEAQYYLEEAKRLLAEAAAHQSRMTAEQQARYRDALAAVRDSEGRRAYDLARALMTTLDTAMTAVEGTYQVMRGDSLWRISGREAIYRNPYYWPMIYKANTDRIADADLIYPGQDLAIPRDYGAAERRLAVSHARNRGAWSLGPVEASDRAYLRR